MMNAKIVVNAECHISIFLIWPLGKVAHQAINTCSLAPSFLKLDSVDFFTVLRQIYIYISCIPFPPYTDQQSTEERDLIRYQC